MALPPRRRAPRLDRCMTWCGALGRPFRCFELIALANSTLAFPGRPSRWTPPSWPAPAAQPAAARPPRSRGRRQPDMDLGLRSKRGGFVQRQAHRRRMRVSDDFTGAMGPRNAAAPAPPGKYRSRELLRFGLPGSSPARSRCTLAEHRLPHAAQRTNGSRALAEPQWNVFIVSSRCCDGRQRAVSPRCCDRRRCGIIDPSAQ